MKYLPFLLTALAATPAAASDWTLDPEASSVEFVTQAFGAEVRGTFETFETRISLDPADLTSASVVGRVLVESGDTGNGQYNSEMTGGGGLDADSHPYAEFVSESVAASDACEEGAGTCYVAAGSLTLRGNNQPAEIRFRLEIENDRAIASGELTVARSDFGVGSGNWGNAAESVRILLHIEATR